MGHLRPSALQAVDQPRKRQQRADGDRSGAQQGPGHWSQAGDERGGGPPHGSALPIRELDQHAVPHARGAVIDDRQAPAEEGVSSIGDLDLMRQPIEQWGSVQILVR